MSISYHGVVGAKHKVTLPSVETWGANMNILRDPPASIQTRKVDKVNATSQITQMNQESGDRAAETIKIYARGINPAVAVSYDNYGNNGGRRQYDGVSHYNRQAFLPYRVMQAGSFRPPAIDLRSQYALSRLPRNWTSSFSNPGFNDFSKKAICPSTTDEIRQVRKENKMLRPCVRPNATYNIEVPIIEPFEVKYVLNKKPISVQANTSIDPHMKFNGEMGIPVAQIIETPLHVNAQSMQTYLPQNGENTFNTEKYTHDTLKGNIQSNPSQNAVITPIDEILGVQTENYIREGMNIAVDAPYSSYQNNDYVTTTKNLERNVAQYEMNAPQSQNIYAMPQERAFERDYIQNRPITSYEAVGRPDLSFFEQGGLAQDRNYQLKPTIAPGTEFYTSPTLPTLTRENGLVEFDQNKTRFRQQVFNIQQERNMITSENMPMLMVR
jgi:hypothetical protein